MGEAILVAGIIIGGLLLLIVLQDAKDKFDEWMRQPPKSRAPTFFPTEHRTGSYHPHICGYVGEGSLFGAGLAAFTRGGVIGGIGLCIGILGGLLLRRRITNDYYYYKYGPSRWPTTRETWRGRV